MKGKAAKYVICVFLAAVLLLKATASLVIIFSHSSQIVVTEWLLDREQEEKKNNNRAEAGADELFEKALVPECEYVLIISERPLLHTGPETLHDVHLDTFTP